MNRCILVVEHHPTARGVLEFLLRDEGEVQAVDSGEAALLRLGMTDFGCIVIRSPVAVDFGGESSTLLELFDRLAPNLASRVIVITHAGAIGVVNRAADLGVFAIFTEPFDAEAVRDAVRRCIAGEPRQAAAADRGGTAGAS